jgi:UDP-N-acetylmuramoyl-L-alanyl-D-glutamate--2,6-diaminopimelate ligase
MTKRPRRWSATVSSGALTLGASSARPLAELVHRLPDYELRGDASTSVSDVTCRSDEATPGSLFFCVPGRSVDGHDLAGDAVARGAAALLVERWLPLDATQVCVGAVREAMGPVSAAFFGDPAGRLRTVGVTGTNGKTTVTYLLESIVREAGGVPGVIGTTGARAAGLEIAVPRTTPEAPDLQRLLFEMSERGVDAVAMEASSHGLEQHRIDGTLFDVAVFTNLSQDHLDYHGTMEAYFSAKARLFTPSLARSAAIDVDSRWGERLAAACTVPVRTFGTTTAAEIRAEDVVATRHGVSFRVGDVGVTSSLLGAFNASNCLAAFAAARSLDIAVGDIVRGIAGTASIPGRLERVDAGQGFLALVDYAHTPDGLERVLRAARRLADGRVIVVFGCGGDRDRGKRPVMGRVACAESDLAIITSDNPRSEDPASIIDDVERGARETAGAYVVEPDRRLAIRRAVAAAAAGDVVVIAGKGHESIQEFADGAVPFDDRAVARSEIESIVRTA